MVRRWRRKWSSQSYKVDHWLIPPRVKVSRGVCLKCGALGRWDAKKEWFVIVPA
jgi:hypothetical protein